MPEQLSLQFPAPRADGRRVKNAPRATPEQLTLHFPAPRAGGRRLKDTPNSRWLTLARETATQVVVARQVVTSDDIQRLCPLPAGLPDSLHGKVFQGRRFESIGRVASTRASAKGRTINVYTLRYIAPRLDS